MAQLQTGQPARLRLIGTMPGEQVDERHLHRELASYRVGGEWFSPEILHIAELLIARQGPWFLCREPEVMRKRAEIAWLQPFVEAEANFDSYDAPQMVTSELALKSAVKRMRSFGRAMEKFHARYGFRPSSRDDGAGGNLFGILDRIDPVIYSAARYVAAWEGVLVP